MIIKFTEEEYNQAKSEDLLKLECENCGEVFLCKKKLIKHELTHHRGRCKYCCYDCANKGLKKVKETRILHCSNCGKEIEVQNHVYNSSTTKHFFCSKSCAAKYNNQLRGETSDKTRKKISDSLERYWNTPNKKNGRGSLRKVKVCMVCGKEYDSSFKGSTRKFCSEDCSKHYRENPKEFLSEDALERIREAGRKSAMTQSENRRSKNEKYFCQLCEEHFKNVRHNEPIFNGWDADVIIDDIKCAVLWNGKWHYEKITDKHSPKQVQNRDRIKINEIQKYGYNACVIKDMGKYNKEFVEQKFKEFIEAIKDKKQDKIEI